MKKVSFILSARDDGYAGNFLERFELALSKNLEVLSRYSELDYEMIIVDYNPEKGKELIENSKLKYLLSHVDVKNIIVDRSVIMSKDLPHNGFFEYYAKNLGALKSKGELLFMTNADIALSNDIVEFLINLKVSDLDKKFVRFRYRQDVDPSTKKLVGPPMDLHFPDDVDEPICGVYSGDATMFTRKSFIEDATGYNESNSNHNNIAGQASMDCEILWNLVNLGYEKLLIDKVYYHIWHQRQPKDGEYDKTPYKNNEDWGCCSFPVEVVNSNTIKVYSK